MRTAIQNLPGSKIREVANAALAAGAAAQDVLAFWFGESDELTPEPIRRAAADALMRGETFYSHNLGLLELRQGIADYASGLHGQIDVDRIAVTSSGVTALMLAMQMLVGAGDEVVAVDGLPDAGDSLALAKHLVARHGLGLAPGAAFGDEGEGWSRWCFASQAPARLDLGLARLRGALGL